MSRKRGCFIAFVIIILLLGLFVFLQIPSTQFRGLPKDVGTTVISEPVKPDGTIDYLTFLNERLSEGVTPENNAVVLLVRPLGIERAELQGPFYKQFCAALGIDGFEHNPELIAPINWIRDKYETDDEILSAEAFNELMREAEELTRPWKSADHSDFAEALEQQQEALDLIVEATKRPRYYHPLVIEPLGEENVELLVAALLPLAQQCRHAARQLRFRAMNSLGEGDIPAAIEDVKAIRRLGKLVSQSFTLIERLVSLAVHDMGCDAEQQLLGSGLLTREQLEDYREFIAAYPVTSDLADRIGIGERFMCLDILQHTPEHGSKAVMYALPGGGPESSHWQTAFLNLVLSSSDMGHAMRTSNQWYDKGVEALQQETPRQRHEACEELIQEIYELETDLSNPRKAILALLSNPQNRGKMVGKFMVASFFPAMQQVNNYEFRMQLQSHLVQVACLIEIYRKEFGSYPESLDDVEAQEGSSELLTDPLSEQRLEYRKTDSGYLLYSIGVDGVDNGGRAWRETADGSQFDIRICIGETPEPEEDSPIAREAQALESELRWQEKQRQKADAANSQLPRGGVK